jgi:hypothetical protein
VIGIMFFSLIRSFPQELAGEYVTVVEWIAARVFLSAIELDSIATASSPECSSQSVLLLVPLEQIYLLFF